MFIFNLFVLLIMPLTMIGFGLLFIFGLQFIGLLLPIVPTEVALKSRFDKNGNRK
jgi:hypothetical protein